MLPRTGDLLARKYRIGRELGRGAMGIVYEARHETLDQRVAIKILRRSEIEDEEAAVRRFEREARIVAKLDSPHVVKVIDVDRTEEGVPYLVMELLEGRDLSAEMDARGETPVSTAEATRWMVQVCDAMRVAHDAGVVHRDLKLSNVFLTREDTVKVLDFGVAVLRSGDTDRSITMSVAGTPRYMAPEQLLGEPPNPSSDIWAIGVMLYRMLGGRFPYDSPTMAAQMLAMMEGCPPLDAVAPQVPRALAEIVGRALGHTLEQRWPSAKALSLALAPFREAREDVAPEPSSRGDEGARAPPPERPRAARGPRFGRAARYVALLGTGGALLAVGERVLRAPDPGVTIAAPIRDAAVEAVMPPTPTTAASAGSVSSAPDGAHDAAPPMASSIVAPRPRATAATTSVPGPAPRAAPSRSESPDDGFPPHL